MRRALRPALLWIGLSGGDAVGYPLHSITAAELVLVMTNGTRATWTRAPAD